MSSILATVAMPMHQTMHCGGACHYVPMYMVTLDANQQVYEVPASKPAGTSVYQLITKWDCYYWLYVSKFGFLPSMYMTGC